MCGITGAFRISTAATPPPLPEHVLRRMTDADRVPRPRRRRLRVRRAAARWARAGSRSSTSRAATSPSPTRAGASGPRRTARSTTTTRCARELAEPRPHAAQPLRHRGAPAPLRGARPRAERAPARHVRRRGLGPGSPPRRAGPRPARHQAALLRAWSATWWSSAPSSSAVIASGLVGDELDPEAIAAYLTLGFVPEPADAAARRSASSTRASGSWSRTAACGVERWWRYPAPEPQTRAIAVRGRVERAAARTARGVRADAPDERRAARRDAERRPGLEPDRRADGAA